MHGVMLEAEMAVEDSYGMTEELKKQFQNYYSNMQSLHASKEVDVCYKILCRAVELRKEYAEAHDIKGGKEYMNAAVAYVEEHLQEEDLSIVSVATHIYLNPVYFGRVFKETFHMSFKSTCCSAAWKSKEASAEQCREHRQHLRPDRNQQSFLLCPSV